MFAFGGGPSSQDNESLIEKLPIKEHLWEWGSLVAAACIGPAFLLVGYHIPGLIFGAAAGADFLLCALVVPLLVLAAGRMKFVTWQLAIISITLAVIGDNVRLNAGHRAEIAAVAYVFWASGTLLSSPVPIYFMLRPLTPSRRLIFSIMIALLAIALWCGVKRIAR